MKNIQENMYWPSQTQAFLLLGMDYASLFKGSPIKNTPIDVCFIGSCTNGRISDLRAAAKVLEYNKVAKNIKAFVVPGSEKVAKEAKEAEEPAAEESEE